MFSTTAAPAGYVSTLVVGTDVYGQAWEREDFVPAPGVYAPARPSAARTLWAAPTFGADSLAVVAFDDDGTDPYAGGMAYAFDLAGEARGVADATFAREAAEACEGWTVALIVDGEAVKVARGEG